MGRKDPKKLFGKPLTNTEPSVIIMVQSEGGAKPTQRPKGGVRPMRVSKTSPVDLTARRKSEMARNTGWRALGSERVQMSGQHLRETEKGRDSSREDLSLHL